MLYNCTCKPSQIFTPILHQTYKTHRPGFNNNIYLYLYIPHSIRNSAVRPQVCQTLDVSRSTNRQGNAAPPYTDIHIYISATMFFSTRACLKLLRFRDFFLRITSIQVYRIQRKGLTANRRTTSCKGPHASSLAFPGRQPPFPTPKKTLNKKAFTKSIVE